MTSFCQSSLARYRPALVAMPDTVLLPGCQAATAWRKHGGRMLAQVGFCTVFAFYAYPDRVRLRVSQILVLPPYQRQGAGRCLLQAAYRLADQLQALDVTVRTPPTPRRLHSLPSSAHVPVGRLLTNTVGPADDVASVRDDPA